MKVVSSLGMVFNVTEVKEFKGKTIITLVWRTVKIIVTRYKCANYFLELPNGMKSRVKIRRWFPTWRWRV